MEEVVEATEGIQLGETEESQQPQQEQPNYLVNVGHWVLGQDSETNQTTVEPKITQLFFKTKREAEDKMKQLEISKLFKTPTIVGSVSFALISLELVSIDKYVKWRQDLEAETVKQQEEQQDGTDNTGTDGSGSVETESGDNAGE